jgi:replicative DNA helicase
MHHLKESGALEQDADKIWLIHRDRDKEEEDKAQGIKIFDAKVLVEKNKEGWTGEIDFLFDAESMSFKEKGAMQFIPEINQFNDDNPF